ncbi:MAG: hypothetical protein KatS3mg128_0812 [Silanimonas sp.]|nr:MAG: hypothetical protein KatS3mg128_0812 [Silanimonas sp.]
MNAFHAFLASLLLAAPLSAQPVAPAAGDAVPPSRPDAVRERSTEALAERMPRRCLRYQQQVDEAKMQRIGAAAAQRGVGVVWINPPMRRVCVSWA